MRIFTLFIFLILGMTKSYSQVFTFSDLQTNELPRTVWKVTVDPKKKLVEYYMDDIKMRSFRFYDYKKYLTGISFSIKQGEAAKDFEAFVKQGESAKNKCNSLWISRYFPHVLLLPLGVDEYWVDLKMRENSKIGRWDSEALIEYMKGNSTSSATTKTNTTARTGTPATKPAATTTKPAVAKSATTSLIASPALPKKMTEVQMVMNPFGVLKKDLKGYTYRQVEKDLKTLYNDYVDVWEETTIINVFRKDGKGYDMSYKGFIPIASCIFQEGRLYSYQYEFYFDRDVHTKESVEAMAKAFVSALKKGGISLPKNFSDDSYAVSGDYGSRSIIVAVHDIEDEPYKIWINILVEQ